jgi:hypothetical protein
MSIVIAIEERPNRSCRILGMDFGGKEVVRVAVPQTVQVTP